MVKLLSPLHLQGVLELGKDATAGSLSSRDWNTRLFVLRRDPATQIASLSCYKDIKRKWHKQVQTDICSLWMFGCVRGKVKERRRKGVLFGVPKVQFVKFPSDNILFR